MRRIAALTFFVALLSLSGAQTTSDLTRLGFSAEPGIAVGTPCVANLVARFWYRNFGVGTCGVYVPPGLNLLLSGQGFESDVMYRFALPRMRGVMPYFGLGVGASNMIVATVQTIYVPLYVGAHVGAYYSGFFAQLGLGVGAFKVGPTLLKTPVFPLLQIGWTYSTGTQGGVKK